MSTVAEAHAKPEASTRPVSEDEQRRFAQFVEDLRGRGRAEKTIESYRSDWTGLTEWSHQQAGRPFDGAALSAEQVAAFRDHLQADGLRPSTVNRKLVFAKRYVSWMHRRGEIDQNAHAAIRAVEAVAQQRRRPKGLSDLELRRFLREVERRAGHRDQAIVYTLLETGLRVSELVALQMEDVNLEARVPWVDVQDERRNGGARRVELGPMARRRLRGWFRERGHHSGAVFVGERGPLTANAVQRIVRKYCRFAKVKVSPGKLRHTFANSFLAQSDGDLVALADLLGHESLETTRLYLTAQREAAEREPSIEPEAPRRLRAVGLEAEQGESA